MKTLYKISLLLGLLVCFSACEKDNYDEPQSSLIGQLTYKGKPFQCNGNIGAESELFQLYQDGFGKTGSINVRVNEEGSFSALLFDGEYKMCIKDQQFPFVWDEWPMKDDGKPDTLYFTLNGGKEMEIKVTPYFELNDVKAEVDNSVTNIVASLKIDEIISGAMVKKVYMYVSTAVLVDKGTPSNVSMDIADISQSITLTYPIQKYKDDYINNFRPYAFVRLAVETDKSSEFLWSKVYKVEGIPEKL